MPVFAVKDFLPVKDGGDRQDGKRLINAQHIARYRHFLIIIQQKRHSQFVRKSVEKAAVFGVFLPADEDVGVSLALHAAFQLGKIPAGAEREAKLADNVLDAVFIAFPHYGVVIFVKINVAGGKETVFVPDGDDGGLIQNLLGNGELKLAADARNAVYVHEAAHAPDQSLCDGKPQPHAAFLTVSFGIDLTEAGKDFLHIFPLDADAGIPYADL